MARLPEMSARKANFLVVSAAKDHSQLNDLFSLAA
jgi:hypothetical protein